MDYSNEINVANEMTNSRRAMKVQTMLLLFRRKMDKSTGFIYYVTKHLNCPSQVGSFSLCKASSICYILSIQVTEVENPHFSMYNGQRESSSNLRAYG